MLVTAKLVLMSLFVFVVTQHTTAQKLSVSQYSLLCDFLSEKAFRLHLRVCNKAERSVEALRKRREVNLTLPEDIAPTNITHPLTTTQQRRPDSYVCNDFPIDPKEGYEVNGNGIELNVTFFQENDEWKAILRWDVPMEITRKCIGYHVTWHKPDSTFHDYCDLIMNENITSYIIDPSKGWRDDQELYVSVFPLPKRSWNWSIKFRKFKRISQVQSTSISSTDDPEVGLTSTTVQSTPIPSKKDKDDPGVQSTPISTNEVTDDPGTSWKHGFPKSVLVTIVVIVGSVTVVSCVAVCWIARKRRRSSSESRMFCIPRKGGRTFTRV